MDYRRSRISLISEDLSLPIDEGLKKFVYSIDEPIERRADLQILSTMAASRPSPRIQVTPANVFMFGNRLRETLASFAPDAVIYFARAGGTRNSFLRSRMLRFYQPKARHALVSLQPRPLDALAKVLARRFCPDVFVAQSKRTRDHLVSLGVPAVAIPSGVDIDSFSLVSALEKKALRTKFGLSPTKPIVLHVGHLQRNRNVILLNRIQKQLGYDAVMVSSTSTEVERDVQEALEAANVRVISSYVENVAELYQLADCYLFPVHLSSSAIEMPLSVLEALACGVPVVSTRFGSLPDWLTPSSGFRYADTDEELIGQVSSVIEATDYHAEDIRSQVMSLSWDSVAASLLDVVGIASSVTPINEALKSSVKVSIR